MKSIDHVATTWCRELIGDHPERVLRARIEAPLPPDVDTPEDYDLAHWRSIA